MLPVFALAAGCGSSGSKVSSTSTALTAREMSDGRATATFHWPKRTTGRLIPIDSNSILVTVAANGSTVASQLIARPENGATSATVTFDNLYVGIYTLTATAYPNSDGSGNAQATAQTGVTVSAGQTTSFSLTMASTVTAVTVSPPASTLTVGQALALTATATDADGSVVLISPSTLQWSSSAGGVATVTSAGSVSAVNSGSATITVKETESGKSGSTLLTVNGVASTSLAKATAFQMNASHSGVISFGVPLTFPSSPTWSVNLGASMSYPIIAGGNVFVAVAASNNGALPYGTKLYALDETAGQTVWGPISLAGNYWWEGLAYENGKIFALNHDGLLQEFDAATGAPGWSTTMPGQFAFQTTPAAANGIVYVAGAGHGGTQYGVSETNGKVLWTQSVQDGSEGSPTVSLDASGNSLGVYSPFPCQVCDYNPISGAPLWQYTVPCGPGGGLTPVYANGLLYTRNGGGNIYNAATGAAAGTFTSDTIPAITATTAFLMTGGTLQPIDLSSNTVLWSFSGTGNLVSEPIVIDQTVIVASAVGTVYALNASTGTQIWSGSAGTVLAGPNEYDGPQPLTGLAAGEGYLVVPAGSTLTAWHIAGQ